MLLLPNPAHHIAQVGYTVHDMPEYSGGTVKLFGMDGRLLAERQAIEPEGMVTFDLSGLASGTYVVVFLSDTCSFGPAPKPTAAPENSLALLVTSS